jgi:small subunit ribosomal protein S21
MPTIDVDTNRPIDVSIRHFKRKLEKSGILNKLRAAEYYEKPTTARKRAKAAAIKRQRKQIQKELDLALSKRSKFMRERGKAK